jgi:hypothetical protein
MGLGLQDKEFLLWLCQRLVFKHKYQSDSMIIQKIMRIVESPDIDVSDSELDMIIGKYYIDFFLEKTDDMNIGYTSEERESIRNNIKSIMVDVINKNVSLNIIK